MGTGRGPHGLVLALWLVLTVLAVPGGGVPAQDFFLRPPPARPVHFSYLALCLAFQGNSPEDKEDLRFFVEYHRRAADVSRFYIVDNGSEPPALDAVKDLVYSGVVHYDYLPHSVLPLFNLKGARKKSHQDLIYDSCLWRYGHFHQWMAVVDHDEFLVPPPGVRLPAFLKAFEAQGAVFANWVIVGDSGHTVRPAGSPIENYLSCEPVAHQLGKSIVNTDFVVQNNFNPHSFVYVANHTAVNVHGQPVPGASSDPLQINVTTDLVIYHYFFKSKEDFGRKIQRGAADGVHRGWHNWEHRLRCTAKCTRLADYWASLQAEEKKK